MDFLRHVADALSERRTIPTCEIGAVEAHCAAVWTEHTEQQSRQRRLAAAARPGDQNAFARRETQRDALDECRTTRERVTNSFELDSTSRDRRVVAHHDDRRRTPVQAQPRAARSRYRRPVADELLQGLQCPAQHQRRRDHRSDAEPRVDHQQRPEREHRDLQRETSGSHQRSESRGNPIAALSARQKMPMSLAPGCNSRVRHAHAHERFGAAHQLFRLVMSDPREAQQRVAALGSLQLRGDRQAEDQQRDTQQRTQPEQRMNPGDRDEIDEQPRRVEQREHARAAEEGAQQLDVAQGIERIRNCSRHQIAVDDTAGRCQRVAACTISGIDE
jgi:hypothetical protein